jgi:hypothetical protein
MTALFIALIGLIAGFSVAAGAWDRVEHTGITSASGPVDAAGQSVAVFTDVKQPERRVSCEATVRKASTPVPPASLALVVNDDGNEWYLIGFIEDGRDGMEIRCAPRDKRPDNATYAYSVVDGFNDRANTGKGIAYLALSAGTGLAIWTFIARRRRSHEETDDASA